MQQLHQFWQKGDLVKWTRYELNRFCFDIQQAELVVQTVVVGLNLEEFLGVQPSMPQLPPVHF